MNKTDKTGVKGKADSAKGRVKKTVGAATGNKKLENKGRVQEAKGKVKQTASKAANKVKRAAR